MSHALGLTGSLGILLEIFFEAKIEPIFFLIEYNPNASSFTYTYMFMVELKQDAVGNIVLASLLTYEEHVPSEVEVKDVCIDLFNRLINVYDKIHCYMNIVIY